MDDESIYELIEIAYNLATTALDKTTRLRQENNKLKQQIIELKNSAKDINVSTKKCKRNFKFLTVGDFCREWNKIYADCINDNGYSKRCCPLFCSDVCNSKKRMNKAPYKTKNGKYILVEINRRYKR